MKTCKNQMTPLFYGTLFFCIVFLLLFSGCKDDDGGLSNRITITSMDPPSPAQLVFYQSAVTNDRVIITYDYTIANADGARMWVQPYTDGKISNEFLYTSSKVFTGSGSRTVLISIDDDAVSSVKVDQLRIVMSDPDQNEDLFETFVDVDYTFGN
ncbi:hypothetical protein QQ020_15105 [Fulvivirgaceae bacterium BMA12]|uniref:Lipoprotein n=1 Tax=Agaribacillus aureus TaxID=3051825 RepID=A0ABT8L6L8_9BACT|nr:hypothetical protein [Fulvivirgaceae bacterium BMA12]